MLEIRKVKLEEVEQLKELGRLTYYDTFKGTASEEDTATYLDEAYSIKTLPAELENPESEYYFLWKEDEEQPVGYIKVNIGSAQTEFVVEDTMEVQRIYVHPDQKRQGFGTLLMDFAIQRAKELACTSIWLGVWVRNFAAQAFYKEHGFEHVGQRVFQVGDQSDTDYIYLKKI